MTDRPSDRAIAQAFREWADPSHFIPVCEVREQIYRRAREIDALAIHAIHCQNGHGRICRAAQRDGITCPHDSCDIDDGVRPSDATLQAARNAAAPDGAQAVAWQQRTSANGREWSGWAEFDPAHGFPRTVRVLEQPHVAEYRPLYTAAPSQDAEDAARLDWMGQNGYSIRSAQHGNRNLLVWKAGSPLSLREVVDAARAARGGG